MRDRPSTARSLRAENMNKLSIVFPASAKTQSIVLILDVPASAQRRLKCSSSEACSPELYFQSGSGTAGREREHFLLYKVKGILNGLVFTAWSVFNYRARPCTGQKCWTTEIYGGSMYRVSEGEQERRNWYERRGEMKRKRRKSPGRVRSPRETIGLDRERTRAVW